MPTEPTAALRNRVKPGQPILAAQHNALVALAAGVTLQRGRLKGRQMPDGFTAHVSVSQSESADYNFRVTVEEGLAPDTVAVTFSPGVISGVSPVIDGVALDDLDANGNPPVLIVPADAWTNRGRTDRSLIMFRYDLDHSYSVTAVTPVAVRAVPDPKPYTWHKLVAWLRRFEGAVTPIQVCFFSQYFNVIPGRSPGTFTPLPRAS